MRTMFKAEWRGHSAWLSGLALGRVTGRTSGLHPATGGPPAPPVYSPGAHRCLAGDRVAALQIDGLIAGPVRQSYRRDDRMLNGLL